MPQLVRHLLLGLAIGLGLHQAVRAQTGGVGIGTTSPDASALLDLTSTAKGLLAPRLTAAQRTAIASPAPGLLVYQTDGTQPGFWYYSGAAWTYLNPTPAGDNLGNHTATQNLNLAGFQLLNAGQVGIGTGTPLSALDVASGEVRLPGGGGGTTHFNFHGDNHNYLRGTTILADLGGQVGIGTTTPSQQLEVAGQVFSNTGGFRFPDNTVQTTAATDAQQLSISGSTLSLTNGGSVVVPGDNLGNHTATQALNLQANALIGGGADLGSVIGVGVRGDGGLNIGQNTAGHNIYIGYVAGASGGGFGNQFVGYYAGASTTGNFNLFSGNSSGYSNTTGSSNAFIGAYSGKNNTTGSNNVFNGYYSGFRSLSGSNNVFCGYLSGFENITGSNITALGANSGPDSNSHSLTNATALGANVSLTQSNTVILGNGASVGIGTSTPGQKLEVAGTTLTTNAIVTTALTGNGANIGSALGVGIRADGGLNIGQNVTGYNVMIGYQAGQNLNPNPGYFQGIDNQFIGYQAGQAATTGYLNVFSGFNSGYANTTGSNNVFSGAVSGIFNTSGSNNVFSGAYSGNLNSTGSNNVFSGDDSGYYNTTGSSNTALGYNSGPASGSGNITNATALGANVSLTQSNTVILGNGANVGIGTSAPQGALEVASGEVRLPGGGGYTTHFNYSSNGYNYLRGTTVIADLGGSVGIGNAAPAHKLDVSGDAAISSADGVQLTVASTASDPNGVLTLSVPATNSSCNTCSELVIFNAAGTGNIGSITANLSGNSVIYNTSSDKRLKEHIGHTRFGLADLLKLEVKDYNFIGQPATARVTGLLAQDLFKVYPDAVKEGDYGATVTNAWAVDYGRLTPLLIQAVQDQQRQIEDLKAQNAALKANATGTRAELQQFKAEASAQAAGLAQRLQALENMLDAKASVK